MADRPFGDLAFEKYLGEEKLMGSRCASCGSLWVPPRPICSDCHGSQMSWVPFSGRGRLAAFTCITIGPAFMRAEGYDRHHPYCTGVVALEEGGRVDARIEGVDPTQPETITVGMPLRVKFLHREPSRTCLAFEPG
jgi:uncharacterized OB-fold protein